MVMSRDIISRSSLSKRHCLSNLDGDFLVGYIQIGDFSDHRTPSGACFRCNMSALKLSSRGPAGPSSELEGGGGMADLGGSHPRETPPDPTFNECPPKKR